MPGQSHSHRFDHRINTAELSNSLTNILKGTEYSVSLQTELCNVVVNSAEVIGTAEYLAV